jgi:hypothetical protein
MRKFSAAGVLVVMMATVVSVSMAEQPTAKQKAAKTYEAATITDVQQKTNTRILYYVVNTPITKDEPYYEVTVQTKDTSYLIRYTPRHAADTLDEDWLPGASVSVRVDGRHLYIKRDNGTEMQFVVMKHSALGDGQADSKPAPASK